MLIRLHTNSRRQPRDHQLIASQIVKQSMEVSNLGRVSRATDGTCHACSQRYAGAIWPDSHSKALCAPGLSDSQVGEGRDSIRHSRRCLINVGAGQYRSELGQIRVTESHTQFARAHTKLWLA